MDNLSSDPIEGPALAGASQESWKPRSLGARLSNLKQSIAGVKAKKSLSARRKHSPHPSVSQGNIRVSPVRTSAGSGERPTLKMKIMNTALKASSSSDDDELLLTSKGWKHGHE